jgi:hypothetical protein
MVETASHGLQTGDDIPEAFPIGQLSKRQAKELVKTGEPSDSVVSVVAPDTLPELVEGQEGHDLSKDGGLGVHRSLLGKTGQKRADYTKTRSNRLRLKMDVSHEISIRCRVFENRQPDRPGLTPSYF